MTENTSTTKEKGRLLGLAAVLAVAGIALTACGSASADTAAPAATPVSTSTADSRGDLHRVTDELVEMHTVAILTLTDSDRYDQDRIQADQDALSAELDKIDVVPDGEEHIRAAMLNYIDGSLALLKDDYRFSDEDRDRLILLAKSYGAVSGWTYDADRIADLVESYAR